MKNLGIPVPDFSMFADLSPVSFEDTPPNSSPQLHTPVFTGAISEFGFTLDSEGPLHASSNSTVYVATSSVGELRVLKASTRRPRLMTEYANRIALGECRYLVTTYDVYDCPPYALLELEYCEGRDCRSIKMSELECWRIARDIGAALHHIHMFGFLHLDVSTQNIFRAGDGFKLGDFGTLTLASNFSGGTEGSGPYASPEVIASWAGDVRVNGATDVFSFGICLLEAASGFFAPRGNGAMYDLIRTGRLKLGSQEYPCAYATEFVSMVNAMLRQEPSKRPTAGIIVDVAEWALRRAREA
jgi:serine/threonine protein kinase